MKENPYESSDEPRRMTRDEDGGDEKPVSFPEKTKRQPWR
jgi:hypothetical protein